MVRGGHVAFVALQQQLAHLCAARSTETVKSTSFRADLKAQKWLCFNHTYLAAHTCRKRRIARERLLHQHACNTACDLLYEAESSPGMLFIYATFDSQKRSCYRCQASQLKQTACSDAVVLAKRILYRLHIDGYSRIL
eukprot:6188321-Pleurochrysis_carterae.AAC.2